MVYNAWYADELFSQQNIWACVKNVMPIDIDIVFGIWYLVFIIDIWYF